MHTELAPSTCIKWCSAQQVSQTQTKLPMLECDSHCLKIDFLRTLWHSDMFMHWRWFLQLSSLQKTHFFSLRWQQQSRFTCTEYRTRHHQIGQILSVLGLNQNQNSSTNTARKTRYLQQTQPNMLQHLYFQIFYNIYVYYTIPSPQQYHPTDTTNQLYWFI